MTNPSPLVSIIIPVYKVEKYLDECVRSLQKQTYRNLEIILVDDGSPDRCGEMCDRYAAEDGRVRVIHQKNSGVAEARNTGLRTAAGEYLFFADSDDLVEANAIEQLLNIMDTYGADMVCSECCYINSAGDRVEKQDLITEPKVMNTAEAMRYFAPKEWAPWNRLMRASVHRDIFFPPYKIHEDEALKFRLLERCNIVVEIGIATYLYRQREGSITASDSKTDRMDMFYSRRDNYEYLASNHPDITEFFLPNMCDAALFNLEVLIKKDESAYRNDRIKEIVDFSHKYYADIKQNVHLSPAQKLRFKLIVHSNWNHPNCLYVRFYKLLGKLRGK